jgi:hypothetical protein
MGGASHPAVLQSCDIGDPRRSFARRTPADIFGDQLPATPSRRDVAVEHRFPFRRDVIEVVPVEHIFRMRLSCPIELRTGLQGEQAVLLARLVDEFESLRPQLRQIAGFGG